MRSEFPRLQQRRFDLQNRAFGARAMMSRDRHADIKADTFRSWQNEEAGALDEIAEIDYLLKMADGLVSNGNGVWKTKYLWFLVIFSVFQLVPLLLYLLR